MKKSKLRQQLLTQRKDMPLHIRRDDSHVILQTVSDFLSAKKAERVLAYRSMGSEVITTSLHTEKSLSFTVYAPVCGSHTTMAWCSSHGSVWTNAAHNILEPQGGQYWHAGDERTWVVCPLLGFDRFGHRIGMGKGYFDRWLALNRDSICGCIGLAYSTQEVAKIPTEAHDEPLDFIITEKGTLCLNP